MNWNLIWVQVGTNWNETGRKGRGEKVGSVEGEKGGGKEGTRGGVKGGGRRRGVRERKEGWREGEKGSLVDVRSLSPSDGAE